MAVNGKSSQMECPQSSQPTDAKDRSRSIKKATVVGVYGVPGSGKTFALNQLKDKLGEEHFAFYEGSQTIASIVPGGLDTFQRLEEHEKTHWRQLAIKEIGKACADSGRVAVVAGHFVFWSEQEESGQRVYTEDDLDTFTHILYLDIPAEVIARRRMDDVERSRPTASVSHIRKWQNLERTELAQLCLQHRILFSLITPRLTLLNQVSMLLEDFRHHSEEYNLACAEKRLDEILLAQQGRLETVLVLDADRTLAAEDTGTLFWKTVSNSLRSRNDKSTLKTLFSSSLHYSYTAFRQAVLLYEETADDQEFDALCQRVALEVTLYPEFKALLQLAAEQQHIGVVVLSCGLRRVWENVLEREGLSQTVKVVGGGRIADGFVVTAATKGALVARLRDIHKTHVWAFGDSPLDLNMFAEADQAIVVVGEEQTRSTTMDAALANAIDRDGLQACQVVLPSHATSRLDTTRLPLVQLTDRNFVDSILHRRGSPTDLQIVHATDRNSSKLLMTPMRDAAIAGSALREAHSRVGRYLATEFLADMIGVEEYQIPHVQGHHTAGYRVLGEDRTIIVALMRGGEPMALGVSDVLQQATFIHADKPKDITPQHLQGQRTVLLVDSVINSGKTVVRFVQHVRKLHATVRIVIVAGVAQAQSVSERRFARALSFHSPISLVALRLSENKFTGRGTTDTGNRLFNTTHLP